MANYQHAIVTYLFFQSQIYLFLLYFNFFSFPSVQRLKRALLLYMDIVFVIFRSFFLPKPAFSQKIINIHMALMKVSLSENNFRFLISTQFLCTHRRFRAKRFRVRSLYHRLFQSGDDKKNSVNNKRRYKFNSISDKLAIAECMKKNSSLSQILKFS